MHLSTLKREHMPLILAEREKIPETLRTPYKLTLEMQLDWYEKEICNRDSRTRYFALKDKVTMADNITDNVIIGIGGIEHIEWENSRAEISLMIFEKYQRKGNGTEAVQLILDHAFNRLNLNTVWGECYLSSSAVKFWAGMIRKYDAYSITLPDRKFYDGRYWDSLYFSFERLKFK